MKQGPIMAIDYGTVCTGLAVSDPDCQIALPYKAIRESDTEQLARVISAECEEKAVKKIVVGLPLHADMSEGPTVSPVRNFVARLEAQTNVPIEFVDEYLTSFHADQKLAQKKDSSKEDRDILSAQILLQKYLEK